MIFAFLLILIFSIMTLSRIVNLQATLSSLLIVSAFAQHFNFFLPMLSYKIQQILNY